MKKAKGNVAVLNINTIAISGVLYAMFTFLVTSPPKPLRMSPRNMPPQNLTSDRTLGALDCAK